MKRKHVCVLAGEDFVASLRDELKWLVAETAVHMVCEGGGFLERCVGGDHLTRNQIGSDAEMFEGALRLRAPEFVGGNLHVA
jgi:hypothetical protein